MIAGEVYRHALPPSRLGSRHGSLASYTAAVASDGDGREEPAVPTEFSLVVILSPNQHEGSGNDETARGNDKPTSNIRILLGKKLRGFGTGFYNCIGGKLEKSRGEHDNPAKGAVRELLEETGIDVPLTAMEDGFVGNIHFTFEDDDANAPMRVHLYCVFVALDDCDEGSEANHYPHRVVSVHPEQIRGCDEIEPVWFDNVHEIPLSQMFADDTLWLTMLLSHYNSRETQQSKFMFDAWFHFHPGGTSTNSIMHHYIQLKDDGGGTTPNTPKYTLEKRLFHALHDNKVHSPSIKEFKENWAMANAVRTFLKNSDGNGASRMEYVLDVAGGHGALGALFLLLVPECHLAVVIDPATCDSGKRGVWDAWGKFWSSDNGSNRSSKGKELRYRHECLRTGLRKELDCILQHTKSTSVTVVACHACQHLTDETLQIASEYGVNAAVMPCCQKDHDGWWKGLTNRLVQSHGKSKASLSIGTIMDLLAAGKMMGWQTGSNAGVRYQVKMKLMNESISEQNRMILCKAVSRDRRDEKMELAHAKLTRAYQRAHKVQKEVSHRSNRIEWHFPSLLTGVCFGAAASFLITSQLIRRSN